MSTESTATPADLGSARRNGAIAGALRLVGLLVCVELASGVLQGYYSPIYTDIASHLSMPAADVNWFEAAQLLLSALVLPALARLGDLVGPRRILLWSAAITAVASWGVAAAPTFATFLIAWALQGVYVVWLPMEVAIVYRRSGRDEASTSAGAGVLVCALELGVIVAALVSGALAGTVGVPVLLTLPAVAVTATFVVIWFGIRDPAPRRDGSLDWAGLALATAVLTLVVGGLVVLRLTGAADVRPWLLVVVGLLALWPFVLVERRVATTGRIPLVDVTVLARPGQWPTQLLALLFGISVLGAQIPMSTFARIDPHTAGYGLGVSAATLSYLVGAYVVMLAVGALAYPPAARRIGTPLAMTAGAVLVAAGYLVMMVWHNGFGAVLVLMMVIGVGSGALVAALPAAAAAQAPAGDTGFVTGMTNTTKTVGGAIASSLFAIALATTGTIGTDPDDDAVVHSPLSGYLTVWAICGGTALVAALFVLARRYAWGAGPAA